MRGLLIGMVLILLVASTFSVYGYEPVKVDERVQNTHDIIWVNNDTDLENLATAEGWSGDGSEANPYVIENYKIDAHGGGAAIYIGNVTKRVIIRNCTVYNATDLYTRAAGIWIYKTSYVVVDNITAYDNLNYGVYVYSSNYIMVNNSRFYRGNLSEYTAGIAYASSYYGTITNNYVENSSMGIWMYFSYYAVVHGNIMKGTSLKVDGGYDADKYDITSDNMVNGKPVIYEKGFMNNATLNAASAGEVILGNVSYLTVIGLNLNDVGAALLILGSNNITARNIVVRNTTAPTVYMHLSRDIRVEDVYIENVYNHAVHIEYCDNVSIDNLTILGSTGIQTFYTTHTPYIVLTDSEISGGQVGVFVSYYTTNHVIMENLFIHDFSQYGMYFDAVAPDVGLIQNVTISNSIIINNGYDAIHIWGMKNGKITGNRITGTGTNGVNVGAYSENIEISNNIIEGMHTGVKLGTTFYSTISYNMIYNSSNYGIYLINARNNMVVGNIVNNTSIYGIYVATSSHDNTITFNKICNSTNYGVYIYSGVTGNRIWANRFYFNHGSNGTYNSSHVQAYDAGTNEWNNATMGNYWYDWANNNDTNDANGDGIVDWPYKIDGGSNKDEYPLANTSAIPEFSVMLFGVLFIVMLGIVLWKRRRA